MYSYGLAVSAVDACLIYWQVFCFLWTDRLLSALSSKAGPTIGSDFLESGSHHPLIPQGRVDFDQ